MHGVDIVWPSPRRSSMHTYVLDEIGLPLYTQTTLRQTIGVDPPHEEHNCWIVSKGIQVIDLWLGCSIPR